MTHILYKSVKKGIDEQRWVIGGKPEQLRLENSKDWERVENNASTSVRDIGTVSDRA